MISSMVRRAQPVTPGWSAEPGPALPGYLCHGDLAGCVTTLLLDPLHPRPDHRWRAPATRVALMLSALTLVITLTSVNGVCEVINVINFTPFT